MLTLQFTSFTKPCPHSYTFPRSGLGLLPQKVHSLSNSSLGTCVYFVNVDPGGVLIRTSDTHKHYRKPVHFGSGILSLSCLGGALIRVDVVADCMV